MSRRTFTTYSVNGMGGPIMRGIPSRDVALILAVDLLRYPSEEQCDAYECEFERQEVTVDHDAREFEDDPPFTLVTSELEDRGLGICEEHRCVECRVIPPPSYSRLWW